MGPLLSDMASDKSFSSTHPSEPQKAQEMEQKPTSGIARLTKFLKAVNRFDACPTFIEHGITDI